MKGILFMISALVLLLAACEPTVTSFEECVAAGNPVMESYPLQCRANGQTFVETVKETPLFTQCPQNQQQACTREYNPVCAILDNGIRCVTAPCASTNAVTDGNACMACANNAQGYYQGACDSQTFVVCGETVTGFDPREYAAQSNGICVDICPGNFDPYMTQIGVEVCIEHYGVQEISSWQTCDRSTDTCECVKAYETTTEEPIPDAQYRCVPPQYAMRLLFRSGQDRLDENGEPSVAIA